MRAVLNPATGQAVAEVPEATAADVDDAVARSSEAHDGWSAASVRTRRDVLRTIALLIRRDLEDLARLESAHAGKPIAAARGEVAAAAEVFDFYAGAVDGGVKQSGMGRDQGMAALDHYSELKTVFIADD